MRRISKSKAGGTISIAPSIRLASDLSKIQELELWGGLQEPRRMLTPIASGVAFKIFENHVLIA
jgi:hypothetical protein